MDRRADRDRTRSRPLHLRGLYVGQADPDPHGAAALGQAPRSDPAETPPAHPYEQRHAGAPCRGTLRNRRRRHDRQAVARQPAPHTNRGTYAPSAASIAARAASAFEASGPPACAMSGRPPPPLPPSASAPLRTRSTALKRLTRSSVTPTTMPALPSPVTPTMATTPEPTCFLPSSARLFRSLISIPVTARASSFTSPTWRTPSSPARAPPPPMAILRRASDTSRSSRLRSSRRGAMR